MTDNLKDIQAFVLAKCGGLSLQHILLRLSSEQIDWSIRLGSEYLEIEAWRLGIKFYWYLDRFAQNKETITAIAQLLGFKEEEGK